jgi:malate/lactate dehydrogenase
VPAIINGDGARELLELKLSDENQEKLNNSCKILRENMANIREALKETDNK